MIKYDTYKDSGIEWLGDIPMHWNEKRLKDLAIICGGRDYKHIIDDEGEYDVVGSGGAFEKANTFLYDKESVLLGRKGTIDKPLYLNIPFWAVDTMYYTKIPKWTNGKYFFYLCTSIEFGYYKYGSALPSMTQGDLNRIIFFVPDYTEQKAIAQYLDTKTQAIDRKVSLLQKKIDYYIELRKSVINDAVTKGLDKNVELKESGIDWIGQIPDHWEVKRLKDTVIIQSSNVDKKSKDGERNVSLCNYTDVYKNDFIDDSIDFMKATASEEQIRKFSLKFGDIMFTKDSESFDDIANSAMVNTDLENVICGYHLAHLRVKKDVLYPNFLNKLFHSSDFNYWYKINATGITRVGLNLTSIESTPIPIPPIEEQKKIAVFLDTKTATIDAIVSNIAKQIDHLKELRKTVINDVVTGKIKVTE